MATTGIGKRIAEIIGNNKKKEFSDAIGVDRGTLYRWIKEESLPDLRQMQDICKAHNVDLAWLATGEGSKDNTDQFGSLATITPAGHREDRREQIEPLKIAPQEISGIPARTEYALLCSVIALFFMFMLKNSNVEFFKNCSVVGLLLCCAIGYFYIAVPYIEKWFYRAPKNLGV
ncbi:MAG: helix-turn-helix domain containing protein [Desulfobulbaceae bacterium]|nr:helix-turn-helix domain containing protein [Desulfobulbaceae bacterium]